MIAALVVALIGLIAYATLSGPRYRVKVCMTFAGRSTCKTVSGKSDDSALRSAITNACADIASGVTEVMGCEQSQPRSITWLEKPAR